MSELSNIKHTGLSIIAAFTVFATLAGIPAMAAADEAMDKVVKARQGYFDLVGHNAGILFGMAKGEIAYDSSLASSAADNLLALSGMSVGTLFPAGSAKEEMPGKTRAVKKIWDDPSGFNAKLEGWKKAVADMADFAGDGVEGIQSQASALGGGCKGCHDAFRAETF